MRLHGWLCERCNISFSISEDVAKHEEETGHKVTKLPEILK